MGNVSSSLKVGNLGSLANAIDEAKSDPPAILGSLLTHGRNVAASLSNTAIEASPLIGNLLDSFRKYWHKALALLPIPPSVESKFQSWAYGGYTPKGGIFASSTNAGMRGRTPIIYKAAAIAIASFAAFVITYRSWVAK
ncbi:hypothetical protein L207DRAFT_526245 [Hyaloscypha variabilis F]|uniref:Uncharacterized protein n=1 Tax=Hyaloscypha variabilis (strain UAMH 11265 / GT02V1 / F) TaxID=1149755 RepID=A0A2J6RWY4_HYAVF|nr:hypothetical protein L207DRAFT_526245 [Hyaloscypha variabilis F]